MDRLYSYINNDSSPVDVNQIPVQNYQDFMEAVSGLMNDKANHCINYFAVERPGRFLFYCLIANDNDSLIRILSHSYEKGSGPLKSLTPDYPSFHVFERVINENFGIEFTGHPWMKPVRYPYERADRNMLMDKYPFYGINSEELHEVGVGPIHAGVIEPGHFRFICNGEKVLHLEIQLGYQHRGVERLFVEKTNSYERCILSESIAGDTAVGHALAHSQLIESLSGIETEENVQIERCIALELERLAMHIGDTAALCADVAYQLGQVVCEALRTMVINTTQLWCGNRFGKGLIRPGGTNYPLGNEVAEEILKLLDDIEKRYGEITDLIYSLPDILARFEDIGIVTKEQAESIGSVGMAARSCGFIRDIRISHPFQYFRKFKTDPVILDSGDVLARGKLRSLECRESIRIIRDLTKLRIQNNKSSSKPSYGYHLKQSCLGISLVEGWRGEICHVAITDDNGSIINYLIKDPSVQNWMALALAVRNQEISDFPVCNKSFNLSYCGNDL